MKQYTRLTSHRHKDCVPLLRRQAIFLSLLVNFVVVLVFVRRRSDARITLHLIRVHMLIILLEAFASFRVINYCYYIILHTNGVLQRRLRPRIVCIFVESNFAFRIYAIRFNYSFVTNLESWIRCWWTLNSVRLSLTQLSALLFPLRLDRATIVSVFCLPMMLKWLLLETRFLCGANNPQHCVSGKLWLLFV